MEIQIEFLVISLVVTVWKEFVTIKLRDIESHEEIRKNCLNRNEFQRLTVTV
jgi:hypothetical protein